MRVLLCCWLPKELDDANLPLTGDTLGCPAEVIQSQEDWHEGCTIVHIAADLVNWAGTGGWSTLLEDMLYLLSGDGVHGERGVVGGWGGFIQVGRSKVAGLDSYDFIKKSSAASTSKAGFTYKLLSSLNSSFANLQKFQ